MRAFDIEAPDKVLLSENPRDHVFGRFIATDFSAVIAAWFEDKIERGTNPHTILAALSSGMVSVMASLVGSTMDKEGFQAAADAVKYTVDNIFVSMATEIDGSYHDAE